LYSVSKWSNFIINFIEYCKWIWLDCKKKTIL